jgi:catechol 2,3-dioxygenase-like lactoylglutathione lyase family enzyme
VHHGALGGGDVDHVWFRVADVGASKRFYELISPHAGLLVQAETPESVRLAGSGSSFTVLGGEEPTTPFHMAFPASDDAVVQAFHAAATAAGYADNGPPGERAIYHAGFYAAFVLDPDGHIVVVVNHHRD